MKRSWFIIICMTAVLTASAQNISGSWKGTLDMGKQKLELIFNISTNTDGQAKCTLDVPAQGAKGIPTNINFLSADSLNVDVKNIGMSYAGRRSGDVIKGEFRQGPLTLPMELKVGKVNAPNRPQEPKAPLPYKTEEVTFVNPNAKATFAGTLTYPIGFKSEKRVPVVLMVTGSGAQTRDEAVFDHKPFLVIADFLARHGIASLRYDDRGTAQSTGTFKGSTTKDFAEDARCGLEWLKQNHKFKRVGLLGHSEGGLIAFILGSQKAADFLVSMAGPAIKGDTLIAEQTNASLALYGQSSSQTAKTVRQQFAAGPQDAWINYFIDCDPAPYIRQVTIPLMAINGSKDHQVLPETNFTKIRELQKNGNKKNLFKLYPGLNHLFQHCTTGGGDEYWAIEETISPEVLSDIANWINKL